MSTIASQITSLVIVYSTIYSGADQRKHQSSASLAFVRAIHGWPVNSPHKGPVTRKIFPFDDVIMEKLDVNNDEVSLYCSKCVKMVLIFLVCEDSFMTIKSKLHIYIYIYWFYYFRWILFWKTDPFEKIWIRNLWLVSNMLPWKMHWYMTFWY